MRRSGDRSLVDMSVWNLSHKAYHRNNFRSRRPTSQRIPVPMLPAVRIVGGKQRSIVIKCVARVRASISGIISSSTIALFAEFPIGVKVRVGVPMTRRQRRD